MAMNNKEKAEMERLQEELPHAKSMSWPAYDFPKPMTIDEIKESLAPGGTKYGSRQKVARGWFASGYGATYGCSDGVNCSREGDITTTQGRGEMYRTKLDALKVVRLCVTIDTARRLADIDAKIKEAQDDDNQ